MFFPVFKYFALVVFLSLAIPATHAATISGDLNKWQPITVDFSGPVLDETSESPNPFLDFRLNVTFISPSGRRVIVPGFFAGDGRGGSRGQVWRARFAADETGTWTYRAEMRQGSQVALNLEEMVGTAFGLGDASGQFVVGEIASDALGFSRLGRLEYVGGHYMKFRDGTYWIKGGTDSPENLLGFAGIDGTVDQGGQGDAFLHDFDDHRSDWSAGDPLFSNSSTGADSRGLIGALNYLGEQGVNSVYFLPMNLGGDGQETFPFVAGNNTRSNKTHYDISKLYQWNLVLNHAQEQGVALNIVLSETETENERWLDDGELGVERKLFFRELIARFGYLLAVKWNLGEENDYPLVELQKQADYIQALDWSEKPIAVHTHINQFYRYGELVGDKRFSASSIQYDPQFAGQFVEQWRTNSAAAGHPWIIDMDENTNGLGADGVDERRKQILYDVFFSGGNIEWYFGYYPLPLGGDITAGNFRLRETMWTQMRYAREMMERELPFWRMEPADVLVSGDSSDFGGAEVFAVTGEVYAVYLPRTNGSETLDITGTDSLYRQRWFDPRTGQMFEGRNNLTSSGQLALGSPPSSMGEDWVTLISRWDGSSTSEIEVATNDAPRFITIPSPQLTVGQTFRATLSATDNDGSYPIVTVGSVPDGMRVSGIGNAQLTFEWTVPATASEQSVVELIAIDLVDRSLRTVQRMNLMVAANDSEAPASVSTPAPPPVDEPIQDESSNADSRPVFTNLPQPQVRAGEKLSLRLQAVDDSDIAPVVTVGQMPQGMTVQGPGGGVLELEWQVPTNVSDESVVELIAFDPLDRDVRTVQRLIIRSVKPAAPATNAPEFMAIGTRGARSGSPLSFRVEAADADGIPPALILLNPPANSTFEDNGDGTRTFSWQTQRMDVGRHVLTFVARDHALPSLSDAMDVVIFVRP